MTERIAKKRLVRGHASCLLFFTGIIENFLAFELVYFLMDGYGIRNFKVLLRSRARGCRSILYACRAASRKSTGIERVARGNLLRARQALLLGGTRRRGLWLI